MRCCLTAFLNSIRAQAVFDTLEANNMSDGVHIRLTLTRGEKSTSGMDPRLNVHGCTLVVLPEYKGAVYGDGNLKLITSSVRRNGPSYLDSKIHHNNLLNNILAKIQANHAGADDAIMLDDRGFLAETNATNVFLVRDGVLCTPFGHACLPGITRAYTLTLASSLGIPIKEGDYSLTELYTADEAFTTGTMGGLAHIVEVDGRVIGPVRRSGPGPVTVQLQQAYPNHIPSVHCHSSNDAVLVVLLSRGTWLCAWNLVRMGAWTAPSRRLCARCDSADPQRA